jgi:phosphohistidine phosphatase SixA
MFTHRQTRAMHRIVFAVYACFAFATADLLGFAIIDDARAQRAPAVEARPLSSALLQALKSGGHVIYIRHASTEKDYADQITAVMGDCSTQRMLSEKGWQEVRALGRAFEALQIPVGEVVSSEYCRAWQTADLAFGRHSKNPALNFEKAEEYTEAQTKAMRDRLLPLLVAAPKAGVNTVIIAHDDPFEAATGIYPEPMGVAHIIKPDGKGGFEILAALNIEHWRAP